jgi:hypothetical protein
MRVAIAVNFLTRIQKVLASDLSLNTDYPGRDTSWFFKDLQEISGVESRLCHYRFLSNPFQFIGYPTIPRYMV